MSQKRRAHGGCRITEWQLRGTFAEAPTPWVTPFRQFAGIGRRIPHRGEGIALSISAVTSTRWAVRIFLRQMGGQKGNLFYAHNVRR